jgi:hypothetical protein
MGKISRLAQAPLMKYTTVSVAPTAMTNRFNQSAGSLRANAAPT